MGREIKRVPLDFDLPVKTIWKGYLNPLREGHCVTCDSCGGSGYSPEAQMMEKEWYGEAPFDPASTGSTPIQWNNPVILRMAFRNTSNGSGWANIAFQRFFAFQRFYEESVRLATLHNGWSNHLSEEDVQALLENNSLRDFTHVPLNDEQRANCYNNGRTKEPNGRIPTTEEVNDWVLKGGYISSGQYVCINARCKREGVPYNCSKCNGKCEIWDSPESEQAYDNWERVEPPSGEGWQLWETVSEGSPITPVFETSEKLEKYLSTFGDAWDRIWSGEQARAMCRSGFTVSGMLVDGAFLSPREIPLYLESESGS